MNTWRIVFAATAVAGCSATMESPSGDPGGPIGAAAVTNKPGGSGAATGAGAATGSGASTSTGGTPSTGGTTTGSGGTPSTGGTTTGAGGTGGTGDCVSGIAPTSQIPRLTNEQYNRTVRDLLGVNGLAASSNAAPSTLLATDQTGGLSSLGWSAYQTVGAMISAQVMADPALKQNFLKCATTATTCLHDTIVEFGRRAFRRPLSAEEIASFEAIVTKGAQITTNGTPEEIAEILLNAFLVSPSFLQRSEIAETADANGNYPLTGHEVASRLSYMLWGSTPDTDLNTAADTNQLSTPAQILVQAQRMLADPKARDMVAAFHRSYLTMGTNTRWDSAQRDAALFPTFSKDLIPVMAAETEKLFDNVVFGKTGTFQDFFTTTVGYVNAQTAPLYGLNPADFTADLKEVTLDAAQRPGFLTRVGFLNAYSSFNRTSPILRGAFITKEILGFDPGSPPDGATNTPLPAQSTTLDTNRKQVDAQTSAAACKGCHQVFINPPGFVMEAFNAVGTWQTTETGTGAAIDSTADVTIDDVLVHVTGPAELMAKLATSPQAQRRYADLWVNFAYERADNPLDGCAVDQLARKITAGGYTIQNLITDLTQTDSFRVRAVEVAQ